MSGPGAAPADRPLLVLRGCAILYLLFLVLLPLAALTFKALEAGPAQISRILLAPVTLNAVYLSLWTALLISILNGVMGLAAAWVIVRYPLPFKGFLTAVLDLPFAIPTLVTGLLLVTLFGPQSAAGGWLGQKGVFIAYAKPAILLSLAFITLPFVIRSIEPVLRELDPAEEEAALTLGAGKWRIFFKVLLPPLLPALGTGMVQSFARSLAEFGAIAIASGNRPFDTLTASMHIFGEIESGRTQAAAVVSLLLLLISLGLVYFTRYLERLMGATNG